MEKNKYEVIVGNVGNVYTGQSHQDAFAVYADYVQRSELLGAGREAGEDATMFQDGEPTHEFTGRLHRGTKLVECKGAYVVHLNISDGHVERIGRHLVEGCASEKAALVAAFAREAVDAKVVINSDGACEDDGGCYQYRRMKVTPVMDGDLEVLRKYF
jgi:hypothetical protein